MLADEGNFSGETGESPVTQAVHDNAVGDTNTSVYTGDPDVSRHGFGGTYGHRPAVSRFDESKRERPTSP